MAVIKTKKEKKGRAQAEKPSLPPKDKKIKGKNSQRVEAAKTNPVEPVRRATPRREAAGKRFSTGEFIRNVRQFFTGTWQEMKKVHWPARRVVVAYTGVVLAVVTIVMVIIWVFDSIFSRMLGFVVR
ncbi:MAG: preprotein translocase subunit SecE [Ammonifex sp.]|jgi:preprotein translocase subunit SecE|nr:MAG: preprotein translocase subunit SecE [Ammonifex sp.]